MQQLSATEIGITSVEINQVSIRSISWGDFKGEVPVNAKYYAHINWNVDYRYTFKQVDPVRGNQRYQIKVVARPYICAKSWVRLDKADARLLMHEYGHYLIGCLCALKFQHRINTAPIEFSSRSAGIKHCQCIFQQTLREYLKVEVNYDQETNHYYEQKQQQKWNKLIVDQINAYQGVGENRGVSRAGRRFRSVDGKRNFSLDGGTVEVDGGKGEPAHTTVESENSNQKSKSRSKSKSKNKNKDREYSMDKFTANGSSRISHQGNSGCCASGHHNIRIRKTSISHPPLPPVRQRVINCP